MEFMQSQYEGDLYEFAERVLTPQGIRSYLQSNGIDYAVALAEVCPVTTGTCTNEYTIDFPDLRLLLAHGGCPFWYEQAFWMARRHANVYIEISGLPPKNLLGYFPKLESQAHKIVYGSDWPGYPYIRKNIEAVYELPISEQAKEMILGGNAMSILGLDSVPAKETVP